MSERLSELSASVSLELRTRIEESQVKLRASSKIIESTRREPVVVNGTKALLDAIVKILDEADELHVGALKLLQETYGHSRPVDDEPVEQPVVRKVEDT